MKEYDLNVKALQIIKVKAETEKEAVEQAFCEAFGQRRSYWASTEYEIVNIQEITKLNHVQP